MRHWMRQCDTEISAAPSGRGGTWGTEGQIIFAPTSGSPLMRVAASGGEPVPLTTLDTSTGEMSHRFPALLPSGKLLYVVMNRNDTKTELRFTDPAHPSTSTRLVKSGAAGFARGYLFFPQDRTLFAQPFDDRRGTMREDPTPVTDVDTADMIGLSAFSISQTGTLAVRGSPVAATQLTVVARDGRVVTTLGEPPYVDTTRFTIEQPRLSPNGEWMAYVSNQSGRRGVYIQRFPKPDSPHQVSTDGGIEPRWRRDGRELYYVSSASRLVAVPVDLAHDARIATAIELFTIHQPGGFASPYYWYDVVPDGRQFVVANMLAQERDTNALTMIVNWSPPREEKR